MIIKICILAMAANGSLSERVTVTMPAELVADIDRYARNRRRRQELLQSLDHPHLDSLATASLGLTNWADDLPACDTDLLDPAAGIAVRWTQEQGWLEQQP